MLFAYVRKMSTTSSFRFQRKVVFLTFPKCNVDKEVVMARIKSRWHGGVEWAIVAAELHKDGTPHLHCLIKHANRWDIKNQTYFDFLAKKHPNISKAIPAWRTAEYVLKDGDYVEWKIDAKEFVKLGKAKKNTQHARMAKRIRQGDTLDDLVMDCGEYMIQNGRKVVLYYGMMQGAKRRKNEEEKEWPCPVAGDRGPSEDVAEWLRKNVCQPRALGQKNLWISGGTGIGKTHLKEQLQAVCRVYEAPYDGKWDDEYEDGLYDLVIFDEFRGQKTITAMNRWLGSETTPLCRRGRAPILKRDKLPCLVLSNYDPPGAYTNARDTERGSVSLVALERRVKVLDYHPLDDGAPVKHLNIMFEPWPFKDRPLEDSM